MFVPRWLSQVQRSLFSQQSQLSRKARRRAAGSRRVRLSLEGLEERLTPSSAPPINYTPPNTGQVSPFAAPATTTTVSPATIAFSTSAQSVPVSATVTSGGTNVNEGTVTFKVLQGTMLIGTATTPVNVSNGAASTNYDLPAGTDAGTYTLEADYTGTSNFADSTGTNTLTVTSTTAAPTTTAASDATATFSTSSQPVALSATVTSSSTVNTGNVVFTILQGTTVIGSTAPVAVSNGAAGTNFTLPASAAPGSYTIEADYSDDTGTFAASTDNTHHLTVNAATTTAVTTPTPITFSTSDTIVPLSATVTSAGGTVNDGTVKFTLLDSKGNTVGTPQTSGTVTSGAANVNYTVPGDTLAGNYTVEAVYTPGTGSNFLGGTDNTQQLAVNSAPTTTTITSPTVSTTFNATTGQTVSLTATVDSGGGTVNEGNVTFTMVAPGSTTPIATAQGAVTNGTATATLTVPAGTNAGSYTINASYADTTNTNGKDNFATSTAATPGTLTVNTATTTTTAATPTAISFSTADQPVTLNATVDSAAGPVNDGTVTFTLMQGTTVIGTATTSNTVANGAATATYTVPGGTSKGSYTVNAVYAPGTGSNFQGSNNSTQPPPALAINAAATTTTATSTTASFSSANQPVTLTATVTSNGNPVNEGQVSFTLTDSQGKTVGTPPAAVNVGANGTATATYTLPGGTALGTYTIGASYTDTTGNFAASTNATQTPAPTLTVSTVAGTTTTASNATATFSTSAQNVNLTATVTSNGTNVTTGSVTFTVLQGTTVIGTATSGAVTNGTASASYALPAGLSAGVYTIQANYSDNTGTFAASSDNAHTLTVSNTPTAPATKTAASDATAKFGDTSVALTATVTTGTNTPVTTGSVTFTVLQGTTVIGTATSAAVNTTTGVANVTYNLPAGIGAGTYTIQANYRDNTGAFAASSDNTHTLTVSNTPAAAATTTTASNATVAFNAPSVNLSATVTTGTNTPVTKGSVLFTILQGTTVIGTATSGTVTNGVAGVSYTLPTGTSPGVYTLEADYNDNTGAFAASSDSTHTLTVTGVNTTTAASNVTTTFSSSDQSVTLTANVTSPAGTVNDGTVTFTVMQGTTVIGTATTSGTVTNGAASVSYTIPGGTAPGTYIINAVYTPGTGSNFSTSSDNTHHLTITASSSTSVSINSVSITPSLQSGKAQVTLTAQVTNLGGIVGEGFVAFTLAGVSGNGNVSNGTASVQLTVPLADVSGTPSLSLTYTDNAATPTFSDASFSRLLYLTPFNALLPSNVSFTADGFSLNQIQLGKNPFVAFANSLEGLLIQINIGSLTLPVSYQHLSTNILVTIGGMPWQLVLFNSSGQFQGIFQLGLGSDGSLQVMFFDASGRLVNTMPLA